MTTIQGIIESAKISRYYVSGYEAAEKSESLDNRLFADLEAQKRFFGKRAREAKQSLRGDLSALRVLYTEALRLAKAVDERAAIESEIKAIDKEMDRE